MVTRKYLSIGRILCRVRATHPALAALVRQLSQNSSQILIQGPMLEGHIGDASWLSPEGNFNKRVEIEVLNDKTPTSIQLQQGAAENLSVSGSPFTIDSLVAAQQLNACFGTSYYEKRKRIDSTYALSRKKAPVSSIDR